MAENQNNTNEVNEAVDVQLIPCHIMAILGGQTTPSEMRLSYSQVAFVTPEQYQIINMRLNDMARTINEFIKENTKGES